MKKTRLFLGITALVFAFASVFAFDSTSLTDDPARIIDGECTRVQASCDGTAIDCVQTGTSNRVFEYQEGQQTCGAVLKMAQPL